MTAEIRPGVLQGAVQAPPSKSFAHRALIAGALADGVSTVENISPSEDLLATMDCLRALGAAVEYDGARALVRGVSPEQFPEGATLPCRDSGSTLRFLIPVALLSGKEITFTGSRRLFARPLEVYEDLCRKRSFLFARSDTSLTVRGRLTPGRYTVAGNVSSQFISGLAIALPLLAGDSVLALRPPVESRPYIDITSRVLSHFGVTARLQGEKMSITGGQRYLPRTFRVEGGWSNAAFLLALNALGGQVVIRSCGMTEDEFCRKTADAYRAYWNSETWLRNAADDLEKSIGAINTTDVTPFIAPNGDIGAAGLIYLSESQFPESVRCFDLDALKVERFAKE